MAGASRVSAARFALALAVALTAHLAIAAPLLLQSVQGIGADGQDRDALSVTVVVVPASAIETRAVEVTPAVATSAAIASEPGRDVTVALPEAAAAAQSVLEPPTEPKRVEHRPVEPAQLPTPDPVLAAKPVAEPEPQLPQTITEPTPPPAVTGGVASLGTAETHSTTAAPAVAAPGTAERYARSVVDALAKRRPKGITAGQRGTVKVTFAIAGDGALKFARVTVSSGNMGLDKAALAAVQGVTFPPPPLGLDVAQLTYEIPYRFR